MCVFMSLSLTFFGFILLILLLMQLTPFVAKYIKKPEKLGARDESKSDEKAEKTDSEFERIEEWNGTGALTGKRYLRLWKEWYLEQTEDDVDNTALTRDGSTGNKVVQN